MYIKFVFSLFIFLIFLLEGLGINNGRQVAYNLILIMPLFLFAPHFIFKNDKKINFPVKLSVLYLIFTLLSTVSFIFSVNLQNSFENIVLYIALYLIFIFVYSYKEEIKSLIFPIIFVLSFIFVFASMFTKFFISQKSLFFIPIDFSNQGYQFIYSVFGSHNHLGDFLLLPIITLLFLLITNKFKMQNLFLLIFFTPFFIFSYSRSAYADLIVIAVILLFYQFRNFLKRKNIFAFPLSLLIIIILAIFLFAVPSDTKKLGVLNNINLNLQQKFNLEPSKTFLANRTIYFTQGLYSLSEKPLLGVGPRNFGYASEKYKQLPNLRSDTSHNLLFDIFVENGVLAGVLFLLIFFQIFHNLKYQIDIRRFQKKDYVFIFLFLAMFLNFQTDYTFLIRSFLLLFFVLLGLIYSEKENINLKSFAIFTSIVLFLIFNLIIVSNVFMVNRNYIFAFYAYPLNKESYIPLIDQTHKSNNTKQAFQYISFYKLIFNGDADVLRYVGDEYYGYFGGKKALLYYEMAINSQAFPEMDFLQKVYEVKKNAEGETKAKKFADKFFIRLSKSGKGLQSERNYYQYRYKALSLCKMVYNGNCLYRL